MASGTTCCALAVNLDKATGNQKATFTLSLFKSYSSPFIPSRHEQHQRTGLRWALGGCAHTCWGCISSFSSTALCCQRDGCHPFGRCTGTHRVTASQNLALLQGQSLPSLSSRCLMVSQLKDHPSEMSSSKWIPEHPGLRCLGSTHQKQRKTTCLGALAKWPHQKRSQDPCCPRMESQLIYCWLTNTIWIENM